MIAPVCEITTVCYKNNPLCYNAQSYKRINITNVGLSAFKTFKAPVTPKHQCITLKKNLYFIICCTPTNTSDHDHSLEETVAVLPQYSFVEPA